MSVVGECEGGAIGGRLPGNVGGGAGVKGGGHFGGDCFETMGGRCEG